MRNSGFLLLVAASAFAAQTWTVRVEEPTGLYRRTGETLSVPLAKVGNHRGGFTVTDARGTELPWQVSGAQLLFPASAMPGETPVYRVSCCVADDQRFESSIVLKRVGQTRVEFGNRYFRAVIDTSVPAFTEVYTMRAGPERQLNLVDTTPEGNDALKGDVHEDNPEAKNFSPPPVAGVTGPNTGWTSLGAGGAMTRVELVENGPMRGRLVLGRGAETWEITWTDGGAWFRWKARRGFRFGALSVSPYVPFNRCLDGSEYDSPTGPGEPEPEPHGIALRNWPKLPGGHMVYYQFEENYGALGIVALDAALNWAGAGTRRVKAEAGEQETEIAITFPQWAGAATMMEARREYRTLKQPLLVEVSGPRDEPLEVLRKAARIAKQISGHAASVTPFAPVELDLNGEWELAFCDKGEGPPAAGWRKVKVPGTAHVQWLEAAKLYTRDAEWVSLKEWWYRKKITVPEKFRGRHLRLQFEATDYYADTFVNSARVGRHEGYIDPYEYEVTQQVRSGEENEITVRVWTPVSYYWKHRPYTVKGAYGAVDQKPDDITPLGITRSVRLVAGDRVAIRDVAVNTLLDGEAARVELQLETDQEAEGYTWEATLAPRNFTAPDRYQVRVPAGGRATATIAVAKPQLWWTWDHGKPNLYTLEVRLLNEAGQAVDARQIAVGIREIEKLGWDFYLNRKRMFIRGTNYYYHLFMSEMNREKYARDLKLMLGMNVNMIRLHCHFSNREFYDLADENGVLIWQDYLEAWYPHDRGFAQHAARLYDNHLRYARNHPAVALWATSDEEDFQNYHEITKHLAPRAFWMDPQRRPVVRSTGRFGDSHVYHGWYNGSIWQYTQMTERFVSELGATSLPNYETLEKYMPGTWPIKDHLDEWTWRRLQIKEAMRAWGEPGDMTLKQYIPQTQAYVARLFQISLERMRQRKWNGASGILHFHAIDIWPSVTMAAIDFDRVPTKTYDTVRRSFAPVAALFEYDRDRWKRGGKFTCGLWASNDTWDAVPGATLRWRVLDAAGKTAQAGSWPVSLKADSVVRMGAAEFQPAAPGAYTLKAEMVDARGGVISENLYEFQVVD